MTGFTDYWAKKVLDYTTGKTAPPALANCYLALFTTMPSDANVGGVEPTTGGYARVATTGSSWNAASGSAPVTDTNSAVLAFPQATANYTNPIIGWGLFDAATSGNLLFFDYLGNFNWVPFTCTLASPGVLTSPAHSFSNGDQVVVSSEFGGTLPATGGSWAGLLTVAGVTTDTFTAGVNTTGTGDGMVRKVLSQSVVTGVTVTFNAASITLSLA